MADNITLEGTLTSSGAVVKTDDDGTAHWQYVKLAYGADNTQTIVGSTSSNPLPVALSDTDNAVLDTIDTVLDAINAKLASGTVIGDVNLGATDNAVLDSIDSSLSGTLTVGSHAVTNAGTFATQIDGDALTALQLIDDAIYTDDADWTDGSSKHVLTGGVYQSSPQTITDGDTGPFQVTANGYLITSINGTVTVGSHDVTNAGTFAVQVDAALPAGTNAIGKLAANSGVDIGDVDVLSIAAGANLVGDVGISGARTSGGTTLHKNIDVDETEDAVKASAGQLYWIHAVNLGSAVRYLKIYDATVASVVVGTTVPDLTFPIPTQGDANGAGFVLSIPNGIAFSTAITIAATTGIADNDSGAPGANEIVVNLGYA